MLVESFLHFAPHIEICPEDDGLNMNLSINASEYKLRLEIFGASFDFFESEWFPEFGKIEMRQSVKLSYNSHCVKIIIRAE